MSRRVILIVLDSFGVGQMPDAADFGDFDVNTLRSCSKSSYFEMPNMKKMGLFNIEGVDFLEGVSDPTAIYGKCAEASKGKDTTTGHWEIAGIITPKPMPTYPDGFPEEVLKPFREAVGRDVLCNLPYSGTEVINKYGDEHVKTGKLIVYTSADSVFQIAAHEEVVPLEELYECCRKARKILTGKHGVGRVIARPFIGKGNGNYTRTAHRHDFSLEPPGMTMMDELVKNGKTVLAVGKIHDIFAGRGMSEFVYTSGNSEGIDRTLEYMDRDIEGLIFTNLVDYDMIYGHRRDIDGYAKALSYFDQRLPEITGKMRDDDILIMTADHGCDPGYTRSTDHTREYIPLIIYGKNAGAKNAGVRDTYADIGYTVERYLGINPGIAGKDIGL